MVDLGFIEIFRSSPSPTPARPFGAAGGAIAGFSSLVRQMLKAEVVLPDGTRIVVTEEGTPQGGPLSPLLSNIVLDEWDRELERRGLPIRALCR